jgi:hypothetical protein
MQLRRRPTINLNNSAERHIGQAIGEAIIQKIQNQNTSKVLEVIQEEEKKNQDSIDHDLRQIENKGHSESVSRDAVPNRSSVGKSGEASSHARK